MNTRLDINR